MVKKYEYTTQYTCSKLMEIWIRDDNIIEKIKITGGCPGNTAGICKLVANRDMDVVINLLKGTPCGMRPSSCPDQLAIALIKIKNHELKPKGEQNG
ncbi:MAG: TIGR03905 family TSCPD domain-containing protein [Mycoplasma sp.]|nr:TIGR03905 family TSCPD domain-containing protein [Mycoplasma sp.]